MRASHTLILLALGCSAEPESESLHEIGANDAAHHIPGARRNVVLTTTPIVHSDPIVATISGLSAGETVHIARGTAVGAGPCPAVFGGLCLDLGGNIGLVGTAAADASGVAELTFTLPAQYEGFTLVLQAAVARGPGGADSVTSGTIEGEILDPTSIVDQDGDGFDTLTDCDDSDPAVYPGALELCDGVDTDCDPATSEDGLISANAWNYATVADAAFVTPDGGVIEVCGSLSDSSTITIDRDLTLRGRGEGSSELVYTGTGYGIEIDGSHMLNLEDLTVRAPSGAGAVLTINGGILIGTRVTIADSPTGVFAHFSAGTVTLEDVTLEDNERGMYFSGAYLLATRLRAVGNTDQGVYVDAADATVTDSTFEDNHIGLDLYACGEPWCGNQGSTLVELDNSAVIGNDVGASVAWSSVLEVTDSDFGLGATENTTDVTVRGISTPSVDYGAYGAASSFTCSSVSCN